MGVGLKGHNPQSSNGGGRTGRSYGWMLMCFLAFGASIFGVMTLHKLKERRIFNLVIKDKDLHLHSLHLHLQKEKESAKEAKRKSEEMKSKLYSLQNQKMELSSRIMEMQSTISSLKEEHKIIESALEEKQNEINLMKEREKNVNHQHNGGSFLAKVLGQKEAEVDYQKHNLKLPVRDRPINSDDLTLPMIMTTNIGAGDGENARKDEDRREPGNVADKDVTAEVQPRGFPHGNTNDRNHSQRRSTGASQQSNANATEAIVKSVVNFQKPEDVDGATLAANSSAESNSKPENNGVGSVKGRRFFRDATESEQKKRLAKEEMQKLFKEGQNLDSDIRMGSTKKDAKLKLYNDVQQREGLVSQLGVQVRVENRNEKFISRGKNQKGKDNKSEEINKKALSSKIKLIKPKKSEHDTRILNSHMGSKVWIGERFSQSSDHVKVKRNIKNSGHEAPLDGRKQKPKKIVQPEEQVNAYPQHTDSSGTNIAENRRQTNAADKNDTIADWEVEDIHELDMPNALHFSSK